MTLAGPDDQSLELQINGYQFPELETEEYDSNWLIIQGIVNHPDGAWRFIEPCLLTYEVGELADWLEHVARGQLNESALEFIEPNISFLATSRGGHAQFRVYFELEARPQRSPARHASLRDLYIELPMEECSLLRAAESLRAQLREYPQRTAK